VLAQVAEGSRRAVVLTEGVLTYLSTEDVVKLARDLHAHPQLQTWIVDHAAPFLNRAVRARRTGIEKNAPFKFETKDPAAFYAAQGWRLAEMRHLVDVGERIGRPAPWPIWFRPVKAVLPRRAQEALRKMLGYARLERA
jgi:O-methyltransferase involved in polyketide biosynthesis